MSSIRTSLLAPLLVASLAPIPGRAADEQSIILTGSTSASVDVTLDENASGRVIGAWTLHDASIGGTFAGFAIQSLPDLRVLLGAVRAPSIENAGTFPAPYPFTPNYPPVPMPFTPKRYAEIANLAAGTAYRFTLLTDGPATVKIPLDGLSASHTFAPTQPVAASAGVFDLDPVPGALLVPVGTGERALTVGPKTHVVVAAAMSQIAGQFSFGASCVTDSQLTSPCDLYGFAFGSPGSVHTHLVDDHAYMPGVLQMADPVAKYRTAGAGIHIYRRGFWLTWETA